MSDPFERAAAGTIPETADPATSSVPEPSTSAGGPAAATPEALARFHSCRWRHSAESGAAEYCTHRDVLPMAGATGFNAEAWCPDCTFYKLRRTPRKREPLQPGEYRY